MQQSRYLFVALFMTIITAYAMVTPLLTVAADDAPDSTPAQAESKIPPAANDKMVPAETPEKNKANSDASSDPTGTGSAVIDDDTITMNVRKALASDSYASTQKIQVETLDGVVTVTGKVKDQRHTEKIVQVIASVKGVKSVNNQINSGNS